MKRIHLTIVGVGCVLLAVALGAWKVSTAEPEIDDGRFADEADDDRPRKSKWFWQSESESDDRTPPPLTAREPLKVVLPDGSPAVGATVRWVDSPLTRPTEEGGHRLIECDDYRHLTSAAAALRAGAWKPAVIAETTTDSEGKVAFPERSAPEMVIIIEAPGLPSYSVHQANIDGEVYLPATSLAVPQTITIANSTGEDLVNGRATVVELETGLVSEIAIDSESRVTLTARGPRWVIIEADGYFPQAHALDASDGESTSILGKVGSVEVVAGASLGTFGVQLLKRHPRVVKVRDGRARFETERQGSVAVEVVEPGLLGRGDGVLEPGGHLVITLTVKRSGRLFLTVVDTQGMPVPEVDAFFTQPSGVSNASGGEEGARLELGPVGEGPGVLQVNAPGFKSRAQSMELRPGDTDLEVILTEAPLVRGKVVDPEGKPVADVMVAVLTDSPVDASGITTLDDGTFAVHVEDEGRWLIEAVGPEGESARGEGAPGAMLTLVLQPPGTMVVRVIGTDGRPAVGARVLVAGPQSVEPDVGDTDETGELTFDQLVPGTYRIEVDDGADSEVFLRESRESSIRSGETVQVDLRPQPSVSVHAIVVDADGAPVQFAMISTKDGNRSAETGEDGAFELTGFAPGDAIQLSIAHENFISLSPSSVKAGSRNTRLRAVAGAMVTGRAVGPSREAMTEFLVNGIEHYAEDGRFEAMADERGVLVVGEFGGASVEVKVEGRADVGDVVLEPQPPLVGTVVDAQGRPVASATVFSEAFVDGQLLTDQQGAFEAVLMPSDSNRLEITARSGELAAVTEFDRAQKGPLLITLGGPTRVEGVVRGRSLVTAVFARGGDQEEVQVDTDAQGRFTLVLLPGTWQFGTRASRAFTSIRISGREQRIELGAVDDFCDVSVGGTPVPSAVYLVPAGTVWAAVAYDEFAVAGQAPVPGVIALSPEGTLFTGRGVGCAAYELQAVYPGEVVSQPISLSRGANRINVQPRSLNGSGGMEASLPRPPIKRVAAPIDLQVPNQPLE
jgi:hypothetical protein